MRPIHTATQALRVHCLGRSDDPRDLAGPLVKCSDTFYLLSLVMWYRYTEDVAGPPPVTRIIDG
ncbi:MAG: hypothetical protein KAJ13_05985, partial [Gemmatimonadetes bacterium]|nr:hypothetical protein [Gemmatimonadota bacterium]